MMKNKTKLTNYLTGVAGIAAITAPQANAAVTAITFGFGTTLELGETTGSTSPNMGFLGATSVSNLVIFGVFDGGAYNTGSYNSTTGLAKFFSSGTIIGDGTNSFFGSAFFKDLDNSERDFDSDQTGYIGFKTSTNNWGYANVSWNEASAILTINSAYVESVANTPITVGAVPAVPEPSSLTLLAAGSVLAARRRRKAA